MGHAVDDVAVWPSHQRLNEYSLGRLAIVLSIRCVQTLTFHFSANRHRPSAMGAIVQGLRILHDRKDKCANWLPAYQMFVFRTFNRACRFADWLLTHRANEVSNDDSGILKIWVTRRKRDEVVKLVRELI